MTDKLVVVDWYASWCKVCFFLEPRFKKMAREFVDGAIFVKVDAIVLEYNDGKAGPSKLKDKCGVNKYPTFQVWKEGSLVGEIVGAQDFRPKDFEKSLRDLLDEWEEKPVRPLRLAGVGETKQAFREERGGGGGGFGRGRGEGGGGQRAMGE
jgi:thiol-disulfide isomerase/thioredoxin